MLEKEIFFIGVRKIHSEKQDKDFYMADYVDLDGNIPSTDYISVAEYNQIGQKTKGKEYTKQTGLFSANAYKKIYLADIKKA